MTEKLPISIFAPLLLSTEKKPVKTKYWLESFTTVFPREAIVISNSDPKPIPFEFFLSFYSILPPF